MIALAAVLWKGSPVLGLVLAVAMIFNLGLMAGFAGAVIPLLLKALKFDPALGSGIISENSPWLIGFQFLPPSSVRNAPAAEIAT